MKWVKNSVRFVVVTIAVIAVTSFTIDATDALNGSQSALSILARKATEGECPIGTNRIDLVNKTICFDQYENSPSNDCPQMVLQTPGHTEENLNSESCGAVSESEKNPWVFVNFHQAKELCALKGARLPSADEWYEAALSTKEDKCNLSGSVSQTGEFAGCVSGRGNHDMVGNVWEWVDAEIFDGQYNGRDLPAEGFVAEADSSGVAVETAGQPSEVYGEDYFWHTAEGLFMMMRGGFYGSENDGGLYAVHAEVKPSFSSAAIGFRCVQDL